MVLEKLDKQWYIDLANKRLDDFLKDTEIDEKIDIYELTQEEYPDFPTLLEDIRTKTDVRPKDITMLIVMGYFESYGSCKQLLRIYELTKLLENKTSITKDRLEKNKVSIEIAKRFGRETNKQIVELDGNMLLEYLIENTPADEFSTIELIRLQKELTGTINHFNPDIDKRYVLVMDLDTKYSPKFNAYCLNNGKVQELKVYKQKKGRGQNNVTYFKDKPFKDGDLLYTNKFNSKPQSMKTEDGWVDIPDTKEWWLIDYNVVDFDKLN